MVIIMGAKKGKKELRSPAADTLLFNDWILASGRLPVKLLKIAIEMVDLPIKNGGSS